MIESILHVLRLSRFLVIEPTPMTIRIVFVVHVHSAINLVLMQYEGGLGGVAHAATTTRERRASAL